MGKKSLLLPLSMLFILLVIPQPPILGQYNVIIEGTVREQSTGNPIPHAELLVFRRYYYSYWRRYEVRWERIFHGEADSDGYFHLGFSRGEDYIIYAYYNDSLTPGFDYVPSMTRINRAMGTYNLTLELWDGASLFLDGEAFLVETTETPQSSYSVLEPDSGEVINYGEYTLYYGEDSFHNQIPGVSLKHLIVPAYTPFMVKVDSKAMVEGESLTREFLIDKPSHFVLGKGETIHVDIREFILPSSILTVREKASEIGLLIDEKEGEGFYLAVERHRLAQVTSMILEAENYLSQGAYENSFTRLRGAYVEISNLRNWLNRMYREALISVFFLLPFLAFTATITSHLLFEEKLQKIGGTTAFYALLLVALYLLCPGSRLVEVSLLLGASLLSLLTVFVLASLLPMILKGRGVRGRVPLRNILVPMFSIAKRSLRRRRLRSTLTFFTVMILVSSFIALTSFTTGYGLTFNKVSKQPGPSSGVLVRAPKPPVLQARAPVSGGTGVFWFSSLDNSSIGWFEARPETCLVAPKYENIPSRQYREAYYPLGYLGRVPVFGILGIVPSAEAEILRLNETVIEGRYLSDQDKSGVLISEKLKERLNVTVGKNLTLRISDQLFFRLEIIGILDDERFEELRDLDGQSPLPRKIIEVSRVEVEQGTDIITEGLTPCSADETLVVTWRTAAEIGGMHLSRLNILCEAEEELKEYAKMMALNKGFRVWASTEEGVYLAQLSSYFQGKGLPLAVPWGIVVLNVVITMLNSLYERRREIYIYSAVGMNPSHIAGAFLAEVAMVGVLGGGVGYLVGLGWYKAMAFFALALQVRQKVSALWVLAAIAVSMAAVLVGGLAGLKGSVVITPSLKRRWRVEFVSSAEPLDLNLPVRVPEVEVEGFIGYVMRKLRLRMDDVDYLTGRIRESREETEEASLRTLEFSYRSASPATNICTSNKVILRREKGSEVHTVKLLTQGHPKGVQRAASLIRQIIMEWSIKRGEMEGREMVNPRG